MRKLIDYIKRFVLCGIILSSAVLNAQTYIAKEDPMVIEDEILTQSTLENLGILTVPNPRNDELTENEVFLKQIGDINEANIKTQTQFSEINLTQLGNGNNADIDYRVNTAVADILQLGNYNSVKDYVNQPSADISLDLNQEGNFMQFERQGVNDLTKSLKFEQTSATPYIIIRSFY
tara:strand:- start:172 stop:702 length:531 start_codon:yes stop_codon:yes gene_type:complete